MLPSRGHHEGCSRRVKLPARCMGKGRSHGSPQCLGKGYSHGSPPGSTVGYHSPAQLFPHLIEVLHALLPEGGHGCRALTELKPPRPCERRGILGGSQGSAPAAPKMGVYALGATGQHQQQICCGSSGPGPSMETPSPHGDRGQGPPKQCSPTPSCAVGQPGLSCIPGTPPRSYHPPRPVGTPPPTLALMGTPWREREGNRGGGWLGPRLVGHA